ncbi:MAG: LysR family transcriptional regulator [Pseudomonadota bacterium]
MNPEWSDFKVLCALSRGGSVAGAARELGVDASTVSRRLAALEESLGACLIVRGGREFAWTAEGHAALGAAEAMANAVTAAVNSCREAKLEATGAVRVSLAPAFLPILFSRLLPQLRETQPTLKLDLSGDYRQVDLAKGEADIAVRMVRPSDAGLVARRVFEGGWCVFSSVAYAGTRGLPAALAELAQHQLVLYDKSMHGIEPMRWLEAHRGADFVRCDNLEIVAQLIVAGGGIGVLPAFLEVTTPGLLRVFPEPVTSNTGFVVYQEAARDKARVRAAVEALVAFFYAEQALFSGKPS